jgi:hypothetical protein
MHQTGNQLMGNIFFSSNQHEERKVVWVVLAVFQMRVYRKFQCAMCIEQPQSEISKVKIIS